MNPTTKEELPEKIPAHIAMIMDGNGRWAKQRGLPRVAGHRAGTENLRRIIRACAEFGVPIPTANSSACSPSCASIPAATPPTFDGSMVHGPAETALKLKAPLASVSVDSVVTPLSATTTPGTGSPVPARRG